MWAFKNYCLVFGCNARHWRSPTTKHIRLELASLRLGGGDNSVYISMIYWRRMVIVPTECQSKTGRSGNVYLFLLSILSAYIILMFYFLSFLRIPKILNIDNYIFKLLLMINIRSFFCLIERRIWIWKLIKIHIGIIVSIWILMIIWHLRKFIY